MPALAGAGAGSTPHSGHRRPAGQAGGAVAGTAPASLSPEPHVAATLKVASPAAQDFGFLGRSPLAPPRANAAASTPAPTAAARPADAPAAPGVSVDGTLASARPIPFDTGTNSYSITPDLGRQAGGNLFFSFGTFSLSAGQTASFTGTPAKPVQDVLVRVTGGSPSTIDGTIRCTYPGANVFLIDPKGLAFGPGGNIDLQGSFGASTSDFVRLGTGTGTGTGATGTGGGRFDAASPQRGSVLTAAAPMAFGFSGPNSPAAMTFQGAKLQVPDRKSLLVAGPVHVTGGTLAAPGGRVGVVAVGGAGQVAFDPTNVTPAPGAPPGSAAVTLANAANLDASGPSGGSVDVRCGSLSMADGSAILADTTGGGSGGSVTVSVSGTATLTGAAQAGARTGVFTNSHAGAAGSAGSISLDVGALTMTGGAEVSSSTSGLGKGGAVKVVVSGAAALDGAGPDGAPSGIQAVSNATNKAGAAGSIGVSAASLQLSNGAAISSSTLGPGAGGDAQVTVSGKVTLSGASPAGAASGIFATSLSGAAGAPGDVTLAAGRLDVTGGARVSSSTGGAAKGGNVTVTVSGPAVLQGTGPAGPSGAFAESTGTGAGGSVSLTSRSVRLADGALVGADASGAAAGGALAVTGGDVTVDHAELLASSTGTFMGGFLNVVARSDFVMKDANVSAVAGGSGGAISLFAPLSILKDHSVVDGRSHLNLRRGNGSPEKVGVTGELVIDNSSRIRTDRPEALPVVDLTGALAALRPARVGTVPPLPDVCGVRLGGELSSFLVTGPGGTPPEPGGWLLDQPDESDGPAPAKEPDGLLSLRPRQGQPEQ